MDLIICRRKNALPSKLIFMRTFSRWLAAIFFIVAGTFHFLTPELYLQIMPPYFPAPQLLVAGSGVAEVAGGIGLLIPRVRRMAGWGLIALLVAVFPANIYMLQHPGQFHFASWLLWARLPLQGIFIAWVWFSAIQREPCQPINSETPR
jgi:uncharacterized membrane protein